ncbi:MAG TPA: hypothetical protein VNF04_01900 [Stellaceae bacterium]|nr:hypothetical protein [Stellaceae bacterium]
MNPNPVTDIIVFLTRPGGTTIVFWLLLIASLLIAIYAFATRPEQRRAGHVARWLIRLLVGAMWWQQSLWKLPPYYTDQPKQPFGTTGLAYWMKLMGQHAAIPAQADFVNHIVLPHFYLFAPVVYGLEVVTGASLMLGAGVRLFGILGALQILNLWLGLYSAPGEWPWTYFFLFLLQLIFAIDLYGRSLGVDAILFSERRPRPAPPAAD